MYALTVWQPWAWLIGAGHKLVENRTWVPSYKLVKDGDDIAIHSGQHPPTRDDYEGARAIAREYGITLPGSDSNEMGVAYGRGRVVAVVTFTGVARSRADLPERQRPWWVGKFGWQLANVRQLNLGSAPKVLGQQGLWPLPLGVEEMVLSQLKQPAGDLWRKTA